MGGFPGRENRMREKSALSNGARGFVVMLALQLAISPAIAADPQIRAPTEEEMQTLSARELADMLFGASGAEIRTVQRPIPVEQRGEHDLPSLTFATAPRASRFEGLCVATIFYVEFLSDAVRRQQPGLTSNGVYNLQVDERFKIIGDPARYDPDQDQKCAQSGPVLAREPENYFFRGRYDVHRLEDFDASFVAKALSLVKALGPASNIPITCKGVSGARFSQCATPISLLAGLPLDRLQYVDVELCSNELAARCISAQFPGPSGRPDEYMLIKIATDVGRSELVDIQDSHIGVRGVEIFLTKN